jgi:aminoglycoside phosphotransferase
MSHVTSGENRPAAALDADARNALQAAGGMASVEVDGAELLRAGENTLYRLPGGVVARVGRVGQAKIAAKEVAVARWLEANGVPAVRAVAYIAQPVLVDARAVTFWRELPPHRHGTPPEVAMALRRLHGLPPPTDFELGPLQPFTRLRERIAEAPWLADDDRSWLTEHLAHLEAEYKTLPAGLPYCVVHGDAWVGNVVATEDGTVVLLDLERCSVGPPEWDLVSTAIKVSSIGSVSQTEYDEFTRIYGHDVAGWAGFRTFRDIRELRITCYAVQQAGAQPRFRSEAQRRVDCLRGKRGPRPWGWVAVE